MDLVALMAPDDEAVEVFMRQPTLPETLPVHTLHTVEPTAALRSMVLARPTARSVLLFHHLDRMHPNGLTALGAVARWMQHNDDWDVIYLGWNAGTPVVSTVDPNVVRVGRFALASCAPIYHRRVIDAALATGTGALTASRWRRFAAYPSVFASERESAIGTAVRWLWPNIIGLPAVSPGKTQFYDELNTILRDGGRHAPAVLGPVGVMAAVCIATLALCIASVVKAAVTRRRA
jgi:hypothetical protein